MTTDIYKTIFSRDIKKLYTEIALYKDESSIWKKDKQILNPGGNLCLHLMGNLNTYIGAVLGGTGYTRNRELEFSSGDIPKAALLSRINETLAVVQHSLEKLDDRDLEKEFPLLVFEEKTSIGFMLAHLATHLSYHLGQINYHRRLIEF